MTRRVLLTLDEVLVGVANDMPSALKKASAILSDRMAARAFLRGEPEEDEFEFMEGAGAPVPPLMRALIGASRNAQEFHLDTHELDEKTGKSRLVGRRDLTDESSPAFALFDALKKTWEYSFDADGHSCVMHSELSSKFSRTKNPEKLLSNLRDEQAEFGPPEGHPFRIIPDFSEGEDAMAILASLPKVAVARLKQVVEAIPWKNSSPGI